jgi:hypothetical protein
LKKGVGKNSAQYVVEKRWAGHLARLREERGMYRVLVGKPE